MFKCINLYTRLYPSIVIHEREILYMNFPQIQNSFKTL